ncbi:hypothetical protein [Chitinophaga pinensis]|uniref:hypothetical protein n=1 Tax=Chitinophaga pinensis TaxID=79329 RepID=UPI001C992753|nr:hypothetical protein [Chitinophaga pinensis]
MLYNEHFNARYVREGDWKLVSLSGDSTWHLYKINQDETELNDLAAQHPEVVSVWPHNGGYGPAHTMFFLNG